MKTLLLVNTGNDADIIKESLSHNEKFFDKIIVLDRDSKDNTVAEIMSLNNPKISVIFADKYMIYQQPLMQHAILHDIIHDIINDFDYYLILDADEFIVAKNLLELEAIPKSKVGVIPWKCYVPEHNVYSDVKRNITKRRTVEAEGCHKVVIPKSIITLCGLTLGCHHVHDNKGKRIPHIILKTISIAHFPVRSIEQYNRKIEFFNKESIIGLSPDQLTHVINKIKIETIKELKERATNYVAKLNNQTIIYDPVL